MASILPVLASLAGAAGRGIAEGRVRSDERKQKQRQLDLAEAAAKWARDRQAQQDQQAREAHALQVLQALAPGSRIMPGSAPAPRPAPPPTPVPGQGAFAPNAAQGSMFDLAKPKPLADIGGAMQPGVPGDDPSRYVQGDGYYADTEALDPRIERQQRERLQAQRALRGAFPDMVPNEDVPGIDWGGQYDNLLSATTARTTAEQAAKDRAAALLASIQGRDLAHSDRMAMLDFQRQKEQYDRDHPKQPPASASDRMLVQRQTKMMSALAENNKLLARMKAVEDQVKNNPSAFGLRNTAVGKYIAAPFGTGELYEQRINPAGQQAHIGARAALSGLSAEKIHQMSGAAVSLSEWERLKGSIPQGTEDARVIMEKLAQMRRAIEAENDAIRTTYGIDDAAPEAPAPTAASAAPNGTATTPLYQQFLQSKGRRP